jgi:fermentation-respiration switch protein FrsA (DUF1100 family)
LHYRRPNHVVHCVLDILCGIAFLADQGVDRVALVGHSFGGAIVISAGAVSPLVIAVVAMSSQTDDAEFAPRISPRPLLLIHGSADKVLPASYAQEIYAAAKEPKELKIIPGAGQNLEEAREQVLELLVHWIPEQLARR